MNILYALKNIVLERGKGGINIDYIMPKPSCINNISLYEKCFIIDEKIIDMINTHEYVNNKIRRYYKIKIKDKYLYLIGLHFISIGNINNYLLFIPKSYLIITIS